jgi:hypothetical protein
MKLIRWIQTCLNEICSGVRIDKHLFNRFPVQNGKKYGDYSKPLFFNFALGYVIRKVQKNQVGLKLSSVHQLLAYAKHVNLLEKT